MFIQDLHFSDKRFYNFIHAFQIFDCENENLQFSFTNACFKLVSFFFNVPTSSLEHKNAYFHQPFFYIY